MIQKLREQGFPLSYDEIASETGAENMGRLHIAYYMQKKGLVNDYRKVFRQYIVKGGSAYVERERIQRAGRD